LYTRLTLSLLFTHRKLLKFYFQSFLLGVPEIIVGFRTHAGVLGTVQGFKTTEIPRAVRGKKQGWDAGVCLGWGARFLEWLREVVHEPSDTGTSVCQESPSVERHTDTAEDAQRENTKMKEPTVWRVSFTPKEGVSVRVLDEGEVRDVSGKDKEDRVGFFPRWFWDEVCAGSEIRDEPADKSNRSGTASIPPGWQI
jgi:RAT1-interacting protein